MERNTPRIEAQEASTTLPPTDDMVKVTLTIPRSEHAKLLAFMASDTFEKAEAARNARHTECAESIGVLFNTTRQHLGTSGGRVCATLLASLYNGQRVKLDVSDLKLLDQHLFEHALNTIRLCYEANREPHEFFHQGGRLFEEMISTWGLEKKRRAAR